MGYIQCKHCGAQMSDKSEACPVCGTPVDGAMQPELPTEQSSSEQEKNKSFNKLHILGIIGCIALVGIIVAIVLFAKSTGINSSIYKPLKESVVNKQDEKYDDFSGFYSMVQQMTQASIENGEQSKYQKITYKRLTKYMYEVYKDLYISTPSLSSIYGEDWDDDVALPGYEEGYEYNWKRYEFQEAAIKDAHKQYDKQYREPILPLLNGKKKEWEEYIENHKPENYLVITPQYGYKTEGTFFIDYRPKFYFEIKEPKGRLSDANVVFYVVDKKGNNFIEPQNISLSELKYYDSKDNYKYFSKVDDESFWNNHSIKLEIISVAQGRTKIQKDDVEKIPEVVKNYLNKPDYSNESQFIHLYVKADYPIYEHYVEDFVLAKMKEKDPLCFEFLQTYSNIVIAESTPSQYDCMELVKGFFTHTNPQNRAHYLSRRLFEYTNDKTDNYLYNHSAAFGMPAWLEVKPYSGAKNTYRVDFNGKYDDGYIVMIYENGNWKIDNFIIKTAQKTNNENKLAIDYSKHIPQTKSAIHETPNADEEKEKSLTKDDKYCIAVLQKYYTASDSQLKKYGGNEAFETKRFIKYTSCWDSQVLTSNQDFGIGDDCLKVHSIEPNPNLVNSYIVSVSCGESEAIPTCVIMKKDGGKWKIDNIAMEPYTKPLIDYSKPASAYYAYPDCGEQENSNSKTSSASSENQLTEAPVEDEDVVFVVVEKMPEFPGGQQALFKYLSENVKYPVIAQENGIQGRVICQFVINRDGSIVDIEVVRSGGDPSLDKEAVRVIKSMPKWKPGMQRGKTVRVKYTVPVNFKLQ